MNMNVISEHMYYEVRSIIREELTDISCDNCERGVNERDSSCWCDIEYVPSEEHLTRVAKKICESIGELAYDF